MALRADITSNQVTCCDVFGCSVNSQANPQASFFPVVKDHSRRQKWLRLMQREDLIDRDDIHEIYMCSHHFCDNDIIEGYLRNILKKNAEPSLNLPEANTEHAAVQTQPSVVDFCTQTDHCKVTSHMVCQAGPSLIREIQKKRRLQEEYDTVTKRLRMYEPESDDGFSVLFNNACDRFLSKPLAEIVKAKYYSEVENNILYKVFCLNMYNISPQAYRLISEDFDFNLPSIDKLKKINIPMSTEMTEDLISAFKIKVCNMTDKGKYCSVAVDVMKIKYNLSYSAKQDKIVGFHEIDGLQTPIPARYAVIIVVRGIFVNWTQPIGFVFLSDTRCRETREEMSGWIDRVLLKLLGIGLKVKTFACTSKFKLLNESKIKSISVDKTYFVINGIKIYYIYDFPQIFRELRNNFMTHDFHFNKGDKTLVAKFKDVKAFYERDRTRKLRIATKLTNSHINPSAKEKWQTSYAAELFSRTVAVGMDTFITFGALHASAKDTVEFVSMMNTLYELLNSSVLSPATYRGQKDQMQFLHKVLDLFQSLKLINSLTQEETSRNLMFIKAMKITIKSILQVFEELKLENFKHLLTARLSLTTTQNLFKRIKTKGDKHIIPSSQSFISKFQRLYFEYIIKSQNNNKGVLEGICKALEELNSSKKETTNKDTIDNDTMFECFKFSDGDKIYRVSEECVKKRKDYCVKQNFYSKNAADSEVQLDMDELKELAKISARVHSYSFCDILLKKCLEKHDCEILKFFVTSFEVLHNLDESSNETEVKLEPISTDDLLQYIANMEDKFREMFDRCHTSSKFVSSLYEFYSSDVFLNTYAPCPCFPVEFFQKMFIVVRLYMTLNYNNEMLRDTQIENTFSIPGL